MALPVGEYRTAAGSRMEVSGKYGGISRVDFDWCEEPNACADCRVNAYDEDGYLAWDCETCGGGRAELFPLPPNAGIEPARIR